MRIGVVACGYADGYPRIAPEGTPVIVDGMRTRHRRARVDGHADRRPDAVPDGAASARVWNCGAATCPSTTWRRPRGTIGYELMCAIAPRVPVRAE